MGRLLRDRKIGSIGVKRSQPQSRLSVNKAKTSKRRHALTDKTNNRENNSSEKIILPSSITTRSCPRSILSKGSENESPDNFDMPEKKTIQQQGKFICSEHVLQGKMVRVKRNALADKTNSSENESPVINVISSRKAKVQENKKVADESNDEESNSFTKKPTTMKLRQRRSEQSSTENCLCVKLLTNNCKSFNHRRIYSPRTLSDPQSQRFSCLDLSAKKLSKSFVQLEDIGELIKENDGKNKSAKKPIYHMVSEDDIKIGTELLPEDKIKLYEYEVDANSPKKVKAKRKRMPRKKKVRISDSDLSDEEGDCLVRSVTKRLCTLATSSPLSKKAVKENSKKTSFGNSNHSHVLSPIKISEGPAGSTRKNVKFAEDLPPANSTPNTSENSKKPVPHKSLRFSQKEISSPVAKIMPGRQIKKSIYINPTEVVQKSFSPDLSIASELSTTENSASNLLPSPSQSLKQTKINSFFSTSVRSGNNVSEMTNHNSGLFDELPSRSNSESMSTTAASAAGQYITMRRKAMYHTKPRISGFERALAHEKPLKPMTVENCFGFDDDNDADDNFIPPSIQYRSLPLSVSVRAGCSTPITAPQPTRICVLPVTQPVPTQAMRLAASTPLVSNLPAPVPASVLLAASASEHTSHSPPMILSDPETLKPITFGDEPSNFCKPARRSYQRTPRPKRDYTEVASDDDDEPLVVAKKPKKKGKQYLRKKKQEEDNWASSINRQFEEIDDVDLVVE